MTTRFIATLALIAVFGLAQGDRALADPPIGSTQEAAEPAEAKEAAEAPEAAEPAEAPEASGDTD